MSEEMDDLQWAEKLEHIASAIATTVYDHDLEMSKHNRDRKVMWDDADHLRNLAKELRVRQYRLLLADAESKLAKGTPR